MKRIVFLTENDLHGIIKESVKKILNEIKWQNGGHVPSNGNHMVGGSWGHSTTVEHINICDKFVDKLSDIAHDEFSDSEGAYEEMETNFYNLCFENEDLFDIDAKFDIEYDESTGYGSSSSPIYSISGVEGEEKIINFINNCQGIDRRFKVIAVNALNNVIDELDSDDFNFDFDE